MIHCYPNHIPPWASTSPSFLPPIPSPDPDHSTSWHCGPACLPLRGNWPFSCFYLKCTLLHGCLTACAHGMAWRAVTVPALKQTPCTTALGVENHSEFSIPVATLGLTTKLPSFCPTPGTVPWCGCVSSGRGCEWEVLTLRFWSHADMTNQIPSDKITSCLDGFNFLLIPCSTYHVLRKSMNTFMFPLGSVSPMVAKCTFSQLCSEIQPRKFKYLDLFAASLMMVDINHYKSKALWDLEESYESSEKEKSTFWPILMMKLWFCWFIHLMNTYCVQGMW